MSSRGTTKFSRRNFGHYVRYFYFDNTISIAQFITQNDFFDINRWIYWSFETPGFLLIRRSLVRVQVGEPKNY